MFFQFANILTKHYKTVINLNGKKMESKCVQVSTIDVEYMEHYLTLCTIKCKD